MSKRREPIKAIFGMEPMREGEYPMAYIVGSPPGGHDCDVIKIEFREDVYGDHGEGWFDVFDEDGIIGSVNVRSVAEVHYQK